MNTMEAIGALVGATDVDRVIDGGSAKTVHGWGVVGSLDGIKEFLDGRLFTAKTSLPVFGSDKETLIGFGSLRVESGLVFADLNIMHDTPERMLIESGSQRLFPDVVFTSVVGSQLLNAVSIVLVSSQPPDETASHVRLLEPA